MDDEIDLLIVPSENDVGITVESANKFIERFSSLFSIYWYSGVNIYSINSSPLYIKEFSEINKNQLCMPHSD